MRKNSIARKRRIPNTNIEVKKEARLLNFLLEHYSDKSRSEVKSYLAHRQIAVNGRTQTHFDFELFPGDTITFRVIGEERPNPNHKVRIVYEDDFILVVDKKYGVLSHSSTIDDDTPSAFTVMKEHVRRRGKDNKLFTVHRLDRDISGIILFAKDEETQEFLREKWQNGNITRSMVAVVENEMTQRSGKITSWLTEDARTRKVTANPEDNGGSCAQTSFSTIKTNGQYTLVRLDLHTDYKHQLRAQLASLGHHIAGDKKYGATTNPLGRLCLHFNYIEFPHPYNKEKMLFDLGIPTNFK